MDKFDNFYKMPSIDKMKELIDSSKLNDSNLYDFLTGYSFYQKQQKKLDMF